MIKRMKVYRYLASPKSGLVSGRKYSLVLACGLTEARQLIITKEGQVLGLQRLWLPLGWYLRPADRLLLTQQLAVLLQAGLPLLSVLTMLARDASKPVLSALLAQVHHAVAQGQTLAQACQAFPEVFDELYVAMLTAGELSGHLEGVLRALADSLHKRLYLQRQLRQALLYPSMILMLAAALVLSLVLWVLPSFVALYEGVDMALPAATVRLLWWAELAMRYGWILGLGLLFLGYGWHKLCQRQSVWRRRAAYWGLKLPLFGRLRQQSVLARWAQTFAMLYAAGVPLLMVLTSVAKVSHHLLYEQATMAVRQRVVEGQSLAQALCYSPLFPELLRQLVAVGEEAGSLEQLLTRAGQHYEAEIDQTVALLSIWLEPVLLLVLGLVVGGVLLALYLPLFNIGDVIV